MTTQELGVLLQGHLAVLTCAEDRLAGQGQLIHITRQVVLQRHSNTLIEAASTAFTLTRTLDVLLAVLAVGALWGFHTFIGCNAIRG